jgi:pyruvyl transferase EpsO
VIERHGAFTLLVRDQASYELAAAKFACEVRLCPDAALMLGTFKRGRPRFELLMMLRTDKEAARPDQPQELSSNPRVRIFDWPREHGHFRRATSLRYSPRLLHGLLRDGHPGLVRESYNARAQARLGRGLDILRQGRFIVTDRLHVHILSLLLGIPHCVLDNSYGKLSRFMQAWGTDKVEGVWTAHSIGEAVDVLKGAGLEL